MTHKKAIKKYINYIPLNVVDITPVLGTHFLTRSMAFASFDLLHIHPNR